MEKSSMTVWQMIVAIIGLLVIGGGVLLLCIATILSPHPDRWQLDEIKELARIASQYTHLHDPEYQQHLLWRHRISYHAAFNNHRTGDLALPAYPMAIPIERWRAQCSRVLEDRELLSYMTHFHPQAVTVYQVMWQLCSQAEKIVARPSSLNDHLAVMEDQLHQLNSIRAKARQLEATIRADPRLTEEEQSTQCKWVQVLAEQRIQALLQEDDNGTSKDEVIRPE
jgi:hypothetical protein